MNKINYYQSRKLDKSTQWLLFFFLGWSYGSMDQMGKQILYYLTFGGLGLWMLYVLFTLNKKVDDYNRKIAIQVNLSEDEMRMLGL